MTRATPEVGTTGLKQYRREGEQVVYVKLCNFRFMAEGVIG